MMSALLLIGTALVAGLLGRTSPGFAASPDAAGLEFFEKRVRPLLVSRCFDCHAGGQRDGGLSLDSREGVLEGGDSGPAIVAGDLDASRLIEAVRYGNLDLQMPPAGRLADDEIAVLEEWVRIGAPDPRTREEEESGIEPSGMSVEAGREFWSFRPLSHPPVPRQDSSGGRQPVEGDERADQAATGWVQTPIDAFILRELRRHEATPASRADKRTLLRRVTYDLTGLPPTASEVDAFLSDDSPDAFDRVVDRLLASPYYGERWGRHWLDVARYADSNGLDENLTYGNAWRYRDYVIDAFNDDMPFDRFLVEQVAGDLLPDSDEATKTATGFLVMGAKVLAEPDHEKLMMDIIDEQLDTVGKAFLGMTFGCVRCHDHKFDPIMQSDYYALAAIFKSTRTLADTKTGAIHHWYEHSFADESERERMEKVDAKINEKKSAASTFKSQAVAAVREATVARAAEYLGAAARLPRNPTLVQAEAVAAPRGLHPRILHHCRLHLEHHRDEPLWAAWRRMARGEKGGRESDRIGVSSTEDAAEKIEQIEKHFGRLFDSLGEGKSDDDSDTSDSSEASDTERFGVLLQRTELAAADELRDAAKRAIEDRTGFLAVPAKPEHALDPETLAEYYELVEAARVVESNAPDLPAAMGVEDGEVLTSLPIHIRGSHRNLGEPVERAFPEVMRLGEGVAETSPGEEASNNQADSSRDGTSGDQAYRMPQEGSGRLEFARWMADPRHPLTARVYVNRVWRWHFGRGLVATTENFGALGDRPSHPELLDWLATRFIRSGWSTKALHRSILTSSVYQMSSTHPREAELSELDPENRWRWKFGTRRLEAEAIRDSILAVSGQLDREMGGKTIPLRNRQFVFNHTSTDHTDYESRRRLVYLPVVRNHLYSFLEQFDFPDPTMPTGDRSVTVIAPQALWLMNDDLVLDAAASIAKRARAVAGDDRARVAWLYRRILARDPVAEESERAVTFVGSVASVVEGEADEGGASGDDAAAGDAWTALAQALLTTNEFVFLD